mgnify:CR=1 FL=1
MIINIKTEQEQLQQLHYNMSNQVYNSKLGFYNTTPGAKTGKCIKQNGTRFLELVAKFGESKFSLVTQRTKQYSSEGQDRQAEQWARDGQTLITSKNYRFHLLILNEKTDQYIDVASGRVTMMDRAEYQTMLRVCQKRHFDYRKVTGENVMELIRNNREGNPSATDYDLLHGIVMMWWKEFGW